MNSLFWLINFVLTKLGLLGQLDRLIDYWHLPGWMKVPAELILSFASLVVLCLIFAGAIYVLSSLFQFFSWTFCDWKHDQAKVPAIASLVLSIIAMLVYPLFLSPLAMISGAFAGSKGSKVGWFGFGLGVVALVGWGTTVMWHSRP